LRLQEHPRPARAVVLDRIGIWHGAQGIAERS
jgi:hypothetical protein